jgi:hypothetical protein
MRILNHNHHHHDQPIIVPTAGPFLVDYPQGERAITHHAGLMRIGAC